MLCNESFKTACSASVPAPFPLPGAPLSVLNRTCDVFFCNPAFEMFSSVRGKAKAAKTSRFHGWWESAVSVQSVLFPSPRVYLRCVLRAFILPSPSCVPVVKHWRPNRQSFLKCKKIITARVYHVGNRIIFFCKGYKSGNLQIKVTSLMQSTPWWRF